MVSVRSILTATYYACLKFEPIAIINMMQRATLTELWQMDLIHSSFVEPVRAGDDLHLMDDARIASDHVGCLSKYRSVVKAAHRDARHRSGPNGFQ